MSSDRRAKQRRRAVPFWAVPLVVVAVLLAAEVGARIVGPNIPRRSGSEERAFIKADQIYRRSGSTDVVMLGSSETAAGLVPSAVLAKAPQLDGAYNAALVGSNLKLTTEWAERVVLPQLHPKVVVIGMQPSAVLDLSKSKIDPSRNTTPAYESAFDQIDPGGLGSVGWHLRQRSALIKYRPYLRSPSAVYQGVKATLKGGKDAADPTDYRLDPDTEQDPARVLAMTGPDGQILEYHDASPPITEAEAATAAFSQASKFPTDLDKLQKLVDAIKASGATPVLAIAPVDRTTLEVQGADLSGLDEITKQLTQWAAARDVPVVDEFEQKWPADWFHDRQHVDVAGAKAWSARMGAALADLCDQGKLPEACSK
ncbi:hypothetical protein [Aquihabitans sp. McL0605]|uniref:hypothetical protein n=1 Tax=Aquihabitans sp. McL0605 TaxID=3415671 RepID=UPI003CEAF5CD